ncbi:mechanosensitive ion channel family protein [Aerosakkonemataceae cyanobacterium BLCC-F154]|uniref:Mechanosensitive ion channel family protein n=1 Tax=Floridaenema fluviatile BLCC-F154 TaxID=3153640 RepID=A0ABV4YFS0_9CYAN
MKLRKNLITPLINKQLRKVAGIVVAILFSAFLVIGWTPITWAQFSFPEASTVDPRQPPSDVRRLGLIEVAPVNFENETILTVASPTVIDRNDPQGNIPVEVRVQQIEANLRRVIAYDPKWRSQSGRKYDTAFDPKTLRVFTAIQNGLTTIYATDKYRSQPQILLTVTPTDAEYQGLKIPELAQRWEKILQQELYKALVRRLPEKFPEQLRVALQIAVLMLTASLIFWVLQRLLRKHRKFLKLEESQENHESLAKADLKSRSTNFHQSVFLGTLHHKFNLQKQLDINSFLIWLLFWAQIGIWLVGLMFIFYQFPETETIAVGIVAFPILLLIVWFVTGFLNRLTNIMIDRFAEAWQSSNLTAADVATRKYLRVTTITKALKGLKVFLLYLTAILIILDRFNVPITSVLALGAVIAFAVSLASQNLIRDLVNGCLILLEDQYAIGDIIAVDNVAGFVENLNLRITQIRNADGEFITIPNSQINRVSNLTRTWSRANVAITIAYDSDVNFALQVIRDVAQQLFAESEWQNLLVEPPEVLGIDSVSHAGLLVRIWFKTKPLEQWKVSREFNRRIQIALADKGIKIGKPQQEISMKDRQILMSQFSDRENGKPV